MLLEYFDFEITTVKNRWETNEVDLLSEATNIRNVDMLMRTLENTQG